MILHTFKVTTEQVRESKVIDSDCQDIAFSVPKNTDTITYADVWVNGRLITPGGSVSHNATFSDEMNITKYQITFGGTGKKICYVDRKKYV